MGEKKGGRGGDFGAFQDGKIVVNIFECGVAGQANEQRNDSGRRGGEGDTVLAVEGGWEERIPAVDSGDD